MPRAKKRKPKSRRIYVPINFDAYDLPTEYHVHLDEAYYLLHQIYVHKAINRQHWDEYTPLMADYLREVAPNYRSLLKAMQDHCIIDEPQKYIKGVRATGYRLHESMRGNVALRETTDDQLTKRWENAVKRAESRIQWDVHKHLNYWLNKVHVDQERAHSILKQTYAAKDPETYGSQLMLADMIASEEYFFTVDEFGQRVHTPITSMSAKVRPCLSIEGKSLVGVDIVSSQPYFLALVVMNAWKNNHWDGFTLGNLHDFGMVVEEPKSGTNPKYHPFPNPLPPYDVKHVPYGDQGYSSNEDSLEAMNLKKDVKTFALDILEGQFYERVQEAYNKRSRRKPLDRGEIKGKVFGAFYCHPRDQSLMYKVLEAHYPFVMLVLDELKATDYKRVSRAMQRQESWTMLGMIVKRLMTEHPEVPVVTIHDSIMTTPEHVGTVEAIMIDVFRNLGLVPRLSVTNYGA